MIKIFPDKNIHDADWPKRTNDVFPQLVTAGGPGSGNFGHSGRPGEVGGSGEGGGRFPDDNVLRGPNIYDNNEELQEKLENTLEEHDDWRQNQLSDAQRNDLWDYVRGEHREINQPARNDPRKLDRLIDKGYYENGEDDNMQPPKDWEQQVRIQRAILDAPPLGEPGGILVWRGANVNSLPLKTQEKLMEPGSKIRLAGFTSTSTSPQTATRFGDTVFEIEAIQGLHLGSGGENEVLLPHGAKFQVLAVKELDFPKTSESMWQRSGKLKVIQLKQVEI